MTHGSNLPEEGEEIIWKTPSLHKTETNILGKREKSENSGEMKSRSPLGSLSVLGKFFSLVAEKNPDLDVQVPG